jgi:acyl-CoA thioester hydrolase
MSAPPEKSAPESFRFYHPIEIRYGDIDAQGHVNNACYFTYMEQTRVRYIGSLGLWDRRAFDSIGIILAETSCTFLAPIELTDAIRIGVRTTRLGTKSLTTEYRFEEAGSTRLMATGRAVLVAYDYRKQESIPIPPAWREALARFEGLPE